MELNKQFRQFGYKMTARPETTIDVLSETDEHLSAEDIYIKVHSVNPKIGLTTVYRTLELLINMGMVSKFDFGDGRARYELVGGFEGGKTPSPSGMHRVRTYCRLFGICQGGKDIFQKNRTRAFKKVRL